MFPDWIPGVYGRADLVGSLLGLLAYHSGVLLLFNKRGKIPSVKYFAEAEKVRLAAVSRSTLKKLLLLDRYLCLTGTVNKRDRERRLRSYVRATRTMRINPYVGGRAKVRKSIDGFVYLDPPESLRFQQHEFIHIYQEIAYGVLSMEREGRLYYFDICRVEIEANLLTDFFTSAIWLVVLFGGPLFAMCSGSFIFLAV